jgi:charged multivesicular body protein 5
MSSIEVKIKKLDGELGRYKDQMSKLRNGPGRVNFLHLTTEQSNRMLKDAIQQRALRTLKQKKMYESQIAQLAQQTFNMESAALATENLRNTMATVDAMNVANKEMRKQYGKIDIDKIEVRNAYPSFRFNSDSKKPNRIFTMIWKTCWSKRMRYKRH